MTDIPAPGNERYYDSWGIATGVKSSYEIAYASRQAAFDGVEGITAENMSNNFRAFRERHKAILEIQFRDMLVNLFRYTNVPPTLNTAQLETMLRQQGGGVCVGRDDQGDLVILGRTDKLGYNAYGSVVPSLFDETDPLSNKKVITNRNLDGDFVVFYNKQSYIDFYSTDFHIIEHYADLLADIKATERMNLLQMRSPWLFMTQKNGVNGQILMQKILSGELAIEVDSLANTENLVKKLDLIVTDRTTTTQNAYRNATNEMLTLFGVYNNPEMKKERLTSGESSANNHVIEGMGDIYYNARRHSVELINQAFGCEIGVEWNSTVATMFRNLAQRQP